MTWLSWRQFRGQAYVALVFLGVVAVAFAVTGPGLAHYYSTVVATCQGRGDCDVVTGLLLDKQRLLSGLSVVVLIVPAIIGVFWGAPLVARELEAGTFRLAWTQSVTRTRWLAVKLAVVGLGSVAVAGLFTLMVTWWSSPFDSVRADRFRPDFFAERGIVPLGYAAFAFTLGVTVGLLVRRTLPAMATTLAAFVAVRVITTLFVRPYLMPAAHLDVPLDETRMGFYRASGSGQFSLHPEAPDLPNAWVHSTTIVDAAGNAMPQDAVTTLCPGIQLPVPGGPLGDGPTKVPDNVKDTVHGCVSQLSAQYHVLVTYQPASRYWLFQALEAGLFLGLSLLLAGFCFWWLRRRVS
jgi:hypothetical protein